MFLFLVSVELNVRASGIPPEGLFLLRFINETNIVPKRLPPGLKIGRCHSRVSVGLCNAWVIKQLRLTYRRGYVSRNCQCRIWRGSAATVMSRRRGGSQGASRICLKGMAQGVDGLAQLLLFEDIGDAYLILAHSGSCVEA